MKSQSCLCTSASPSRGCAQAHIQQSLGHPSSQEPAAGTATSQGLIRKPRSPRPPAFGKGERQLEQHNLISLDSCLCGLGQQRTRGVQISTTKPWQAEGQRLRNTRRHLFPVCPIAMAQSKCQWHSEDLIQGHLLGSGWPSSDEHKPVSAHGKGEKCC